MTHGSLLSPRRSFRRLDSDWLGRPLHCPARGTPFGEPTVEAQRLPPARPQGLDRLVSEHAVRPAAVSDDLLAARQLAEAALDLVVRDRDRPGDVPRLVLRPGPDVYDDDLGGADARRQLVEA